jgi:molecular chaperone DnaK
VVDLDLAEEGLGQVIIAVPDFYERCRPLLDETVAATTRLASSTEIDALYITGGGSELPLVARMLRDEFGRKVKRSEYTRSATAIGLAIQADSGSGYELHEVFTRNFGVWRESEAGHRMIFDPIFPRGTRLPSPGFPPLTVSRTYYPVHNIGHFRYLEASQVGVDEQPAGDITVWDEILFPFDPAQRGTDLRRSAVERTLEDPQEVEERYACDAAGVVTATVRNLTSGYGQDYRLGRWSGKEAVVKPKATKRVRKTSA